MKSNKLLQLLAPAILSVLFFGFAITSFAQDSTNISSGSVTPICDEECKLNLQKKMNNFRSTHKIPAMAMTISQGDSSLNFYSGHLHDNPEAPKVDADSVFEIQSVTKTFTAVVLLQLEAEGKLKLDDKIKDYLLPEQYPNWENISIRQLLNMTAGAAEVPDTFFDQIIKHPGLIWSLSEIVHQAYDQDLNTDFTPPGSNWNYSNTNYTLLGMIIEKASGKSVKENYLTRIIQPLNLQHTVYDPILIPSQLPNIAHAYTDLNHQDFTHLRVGSFANSAGGIISSTADIDKFIRALFTHTNLLMPEQQFQEMKELVCVDQNRVTAFKAINILSKECTPAEPLADKTYSHGFSLGIEWVRLQMLKSPIGIWFKTGSGATGKTIWIYSPELDLAITATIDVGLSEGAVAVFGFEVLKYLYQEKLE